MLYTIAVRPPSKITLQVCQIELALLHNILQTYTKEPLVIIDHISNNGEFLVD